MNQLLEPEDLIDHPNTPIPNDNNNNDDNNDENDIIQPITIKKGQEGVLRCVTKNGKDCTITKKL